MWVADCVILPHVNALTEPCIEVLQDGCDVEEPSASECTAAVRSNDNRNSVRNDLRVDGKWKYQ